MNNRGAFTERQQRTTVLLTLIHSVNLGLAEED